MIVDWTKYPSLPEPPPLPEWHDTPEREAWHADLTASSEFHINSTMWSLYAILTTLCFCLAIGKYWSIEDAILISLPVACVLGSLLFVILILLPAFCFHKLRSYIRICRKHHIWWPLRLKRPDVSAKVYKDLKTRLNFDETEFCRYWPTKELADVAMTLLQITSYYRYFPDKMFYPNDALMFVLLGKTHRWSKIRVLDPPGEWFEDLEDEFGVGFYDFIDRIDYNTYFAELAEACLASLQEDKKRKTRKIF